MKTKVLHIGIVEHDRKILMGKKPEGSEPYKETSVRKVLIWILQSLKHALLKNLSRAGRLGQRMSNIRPLYLWYK